MMSTDQTQKHLVVDVHKRTTKVREFGLHTVAVTQPLIEPWHLDVGRCLHVRSRYSERNQLPITDTTIFLFGLKRCPETYHARHLLLGSAVARFSSEKRIHWCTWVLARTRIRNGS